MVHLVATLSTWSQQRIWLPHSLLAAISFPFVSDPLFRTRGFVEHDFENGQNSQRDRARGSQKFKRLVRFVTEQEPVGGVQMGGRLGVNGPAREQ